MVTLFIYIVPSNSMFTPHILHSLYNPLLILPCSVLKLFSEIRSAYLGIILIIILYSLSIFGGIHDNDDSISPWPFIQLLIPKAEAIRKSRMDRNIFIFSIPISPPINRVSSNYFRSEKLSPKNSEASE